MNPTIRIGNIGITVDTSVWGLGIDYVHRTQILDKPILASFITITILCLNILIRIKEEPIK